MTKAHIARNILNNSLNNNLLLKQFKHLPNMGEFIETMLNEGCPAYVMKNTITPKQASDCIKNAKGKVILAHPVCYKYEDQINKEDIQKLVLDMNADGIEAGYIYIDRYLNKIDEIDQWKQFANDHHLSITIGSDFHRFDEIHPTIGLINEHIEIDTNAILQNFKENIK